MITGRYDPKCFEYRRDPHGGRAGFVLMWVDWRGPSLRHGRVGISRHLGEAGGKSEVRVAINPRRLM